MYRLTRSVGLAIIVAGVASQGFSTGFWMPRTVLDEGSRRVLETPEFFWELLFGLYLIVKGFRPSPVTAEARD